MKVTLLTDAEELQLINNYVPRVGDNLIVDGKALHVQNTTFNDDTNELICDCGVTFLLNEDQINTIKKYLCAGNKLAAVRFVKDLTNCSLSKAVSFVSGF